MRPVERLLDNEDYLPGLGRNRTAKSVLGLGFLVKPAGQVA